MPQHRATEKEEAVKVLYMTTPKFLREISHAMRRGFELKPQRRNSPALGPTHSERNL